MVTPPSQWLTIPKRAAHPILKYRAQGHSSKIDPVLVIQVAGRRIGHVSRSVALRPRMQGNGLLAIVVTVQPHREMVGIDLRPARGPVARRSFSRDRPWSVPEAVVEADARRGPKSARLALFITCFRRPGRAARNPRAAQSCPMGG
jgi:hypothetical protein